MKLRLHRIVSDERHTAGILFLTDCATDSGVTYLGRWVTLELAWRENKPRRSCIPVGEYPFTIYESPEHGYALPFLYDVPERSEIEIHVGNTVKDTKGCILVGMRFSHREPRVLEESRRAFEQMMGALNGEGGTIEIVNDF